MRESVLSGKESGTFRGVVQVQRSFEDPSLFCEMFNLFGSILS